MAKFDGLSRQEILAACSVSPQLFLEEFYYIPIVGRGPELFKLYPHQKQILEDVRSNDLIIGLKARQIGWTTIGVANTLHDVLFNPEHPWLFVSRTEDAAQKMLQKAQYSYFRLPPWMREMLPKLESYTQSSMVFSNGSRIESVPATGSTGRGDSVYGALLDECAFMEYAEEIWGAVEPLVYGPAMLFSTANGMGNFFHEIWLDSQAPESVWKGIFYPWDTVPRRNEDWYEHTRLSYRGREWLFYQEYPSAPEEAFARSGRVAFTHDIVSDCFVPLEPVRQFKWLTGAKDPMEVEVGSKDDIPIMIWHEPEVVRDELTGRPRWKPNYVVSADVAEGLEHGDWTYVTVFDVNTGVQCAASKSAIPVSYLNDLLDWLGRYYMNALMVVERNNAGILPLDRLYRDNRYPRLYRMDRFGEMLLTDRTPKWGWTTSSSTKPKMVNDFVFALAEGHVVLHDYDFVLESQTFVSNGKGGFAATKNNHDDVIMGTLMGWQGVLDSAKYKLFWEDSSVLPPTHDELDAIWFKDKRVRNIDLLEVPLGQKPQAEVVRTVVLTPANYRRYT